MAQPIDPPDCFCGTETEYIDSAAFYHGRSYGMRWICKRWPECRGSVGSHPDGRPLGTIPDESTKKLRIELHSIVDAIWHGKTGKEKRYARGSAYRWLQNLTGLSQEDCHIGMFDEEACRFALKRVAEVPYERRKELMPRNSE